MNDNCDYCDLADGGACNGTCGEVYDAWVDRRMEMRRQHEMATFGQRDQTVNGNVHNSDRDMGRTVVKARPPIVCLCGSTRFYDEFQQANFRETMAGKIVLSVGFYPHAIKEAHGEGVGITPEDKERLDDLHLRKIDVADEIFVINKNGYLGESTRHEIAYAFMHDKIIRWLEPEHMPLKAEIQAWTWFGA